MCDVFVPVCSLYLSTPYYICISVSLFLLSSAVSSSTREGAKKRLHSCLFAIYFVSFLYKT